MTEPSEPLTSREREVLDCARSGLTAAETGLRLGITGHTVKWFRASAIRKLAAANITEAVAIATARGLLEVAV